MDGVNARDLTLEMLGVTPDFPDLIVCDASFISLVKLLPTALALAPPGAGLLALIKPQFEVGRGNVGKGGVVRDVTLHAQTIARVEQWLMNEMGWTHIGTVPSPIDGPDGNREFLIAATKPVE
jgi:23S rRNA (cytidine1920-2'-O)/16S rRNA (cytidine1409-2'-O)-methyltransferase